jgi:hypothetical protein
MKKRIVYEMACLLMLSLFAGRTMAQTDCNYLAYEGFAYQANTPLHGLSSGAGWLGSWQVQNNNLTTPGYWIQSGSLAYSNLQSTDGQASGGYAYLTSGRRFNTTPQGPFADYMVVDNPLIGTQTDGQELWFSALAQKNSNNNDELELTLHDNELPTCPLCPNTSQIAVGYFGASSNVAGQRRWSLQINGITYPTSVPLQLNTPALLVLRLRFLPTYTALDLYVNPSGLGNAGPGSPQLSQNTSNPHLIRSLAFYSGPNPGDGQVDELRFASSYSCVAPDPGILVNQAPVPVIQATTISGSVPFLVEFDGTDSYDPEGGTLSYTWNFGDGSPSVDGPITSHTYSVGGGVFKASLTVTDPQGTQATNTIDITALEPGQSLPCLTTLSCEAMADCSGQGGRLAVYLEPNTEQSLHLNGQLVNPTSGSTYHNLQAGIYQLEVTGANGCADNFDVHIQVDSTTCPGWSPSACAMQIGTNLSGFADWEPHRAMRNFLKNTRAEPIPYSDACNCWSFNNAQAVLAQMQFDENGYPLSLPQTTSGGSTKLRFFVSASGQNMPPGQTYVLLYDGSGTITVQGGANNVNSSPGRIQFNLGGDGTFWFHLESSQTGNHVRNIRIVRLADEFADLENEPFYQVFLERIEPFQNLRFMDWMHTNNSTNVRWEDRKLPGHFTYGGDQGVPYEIIIQLANQLKKDIWICVPHAADNDYIANMARLFRDELDEDLVIYLEYSNEVWNWIFEQAQYNIQNNPLNLMYGRAMAQKARNVFRIWHEEFGEESCRVQRVLGIQAGFNYLNEHILAHLRQDEWDFGSPTHYFGLDHDETGMPRLDLLGASATVADVMENARNNFESFRPFVKQDYRNIRVLGKEVITYEGGQHFVGNVFGIPYPYQQAMWDAQHTMEMYNMYQMMLDSIKHWGCRMASNFSLAGEQESIYGSWGVLDDIDQPGPYIVTAPKYQVHLDNLHDQSCVETRREELLNCETPVSVQEQPGEPDSETLVLYPNPGTDVLYLQYSGQAEPVMLYNLTGQLIRRTLEKELHVANIPAGVYIIQFRGQAYKWVKIE